MFGLFVDSIFYSFWQNKVGDIFIDNTLAKLGLAFSNHSLYFYPGLSSSPSRYSFDENKNITIESSEIIISDSLIEEESVSEEVVTYLTISAVPFIVNGLKVDKC